jgi:hypothetical protein
MLLPALSRSFAHVPDGVETVINNWNKAVRKPVHYLETLSEVTARLDVIPDEVYAAVIERLLSDGVDSLATVLFSEMHNSWESSNLEHCTRLYPRMHLARDLVIRKCGF